VIGAKGRKIKNDSSCVRRSNSPRPDGHPVKRGRGAAELAANTFPVISFRKYHLGGVNCYNSETNHILKAMGSSS
jgi:hypothetical protein